MYFSRVRVRPDIQALSQLHHVLQGNGYGVHQLLWGLFPGGNNRSFLFREEIAGEQLPYHKGATGEPIYYIVSQQEPIKNNPLFVVESKHYSPRLESGDRLSFKLRANPTISRKETGRQNSVRHDIVMDAQHHYLRELARDIRVPEDGKKSDLKKRVLAAWLSSKNSDITAKIEGIIEGNKRYQELLAQKLAPIELLDLALKASADSALERWLTEKGNTNGFLLVHDEKQSRLKFQGESYRWHALPTKGRTAGFSSVDFEGEIEVTDPGLLVKAIFTGIGHAKSFGCGLMLVRRA